MNRFILTTLCCALALVGCSGNQQKLEECFDKAAEKLQFFRNSSAAAELNCLGTGSSTPACIDFEQMVRQQRLEDEERCVKLYK